MDNITRVTVHIEELESFLGFLADKADSAYQPEVDNAIKDYLQSLDSRKESPSVDMESLLHAVQLYKDSFYEDFTPAFKVGTKTSLTGKVAELSVYHPDAPSDKPKILVELEGATEAHIEHLNDIQTNLFEEFE